MGRALQRIERRERCRGAYWAFSAAACLLGCVTVPRDAAQRSLYTDLRKAVQISEDAGWIVTWVRLQADLEPALRSVCQTPPEAREGLERWLEAQIAREGGAADSQYRQNGGKLGPVEEALSLQHTLELLRFANAQPGACPFWLSPSASFQGAQTDAGSWLILAETIGFGSYVVNTHVPAFSGGGRLFFGRGIGSDLTLAVGAELAAGGAFIPGKGSSGLDAAFGVATPVMLRLTRFSRIADLELAPVARFTGSEPGWPPGARIELGGGFSSLRSGAFMSYYMLYVGYEFHARAHAVPADHTLQVGTRIAVDWAL